MAGLAPSRGSDDLPQRPPSATNRRSSGSDDVKADDPGPVSIVSQSERISDDGHVRDVSTNHVTAAYVDGRYAEGKTEAETGATSGLTSEREDDHVIEVHQSDDVKEGGSNPGSSVIYAKVIKRPRPMTSSENDNCFSNDSDDANRPNNDEDDDDDDDGDTRNRRESPVVEWNAAPSGDTDLYQRREFQKGNPYSELNLDPEHNPNPEHKPDPEHIQYPEDGDERLGDEWQEMVLQVGDDLDLEAGSSMDEAQIRRRSPSPDYSEHRAVTFSADTKDNEGRSRRYPAEGATVMNTWPKQWTSDPECEISLSQREYGTMPLPTPGNSRLVTGSTTVLPSAPPASNTRLFPAITTVLPPGTPAAAPSFGAFQDSANPAGLGRGIWITDTDTWRRNPDNTSVITIDVGGESKSLASVSQEGGASVGRLHGSLNHEGSVTYPTMLVTSSAYANSRAGLQLNGTKLNYLSSSAKGDASENIKYEKNKAIEKERKQRKCRIIAFAVVIVIVIAAFIGILVNFT